MFVGRAMVALRGLPMNDPSFFKGKKRFTHCAVQVGRQAGGVRDVGRGGRGPGGGGGMCCKVR